MNTMRYTGEYKGVVVDVADPLKLNRARVRVKGVFDSAVTEDIPWASWRSSTPAKLGGSTCKPVKDAKVWVRFLEGDINFPIYSGGVIESTGDLPKNTKDNRFILYESPNKRITVTVNEDLGDIEIKTDKYNTTLGTLLDMFLKHGHQSGAGPTALPMTLPDFVPIVLATFKTGTLV